VYTVTYTASDGEGNTAAITRSVSVVSPCEVPPSTLCVIPTDKGYGRCSACDSGGVCTCAVDLTSPALEAPVGVFHETRNVHQAIYNSQQKHATTRNI
jgi:hypothetical protein